MAELLGVLRPDTDEEPCLYPGSSHPRHQQPEFTEALTLYHQALATEKVAPDAALAIGYTYEEQSKKKDAIKWFQRTCKLYPAPATPVRPTPILQKKYVISVTLGGSREK